MKQQDLCTCLALTTLFAYKIWYSLTLCNSFSFFLFFFFFSFDTYFSSLLLSQDNSLFLLYTITLLSTSAQCFATLDKLLSIGYGTQTEDMAIKGKTSYTYVVTWYDHGLAAG